MNTLTQNALLVNLTVSLPAITMSDKDMQRRLIEEYGMTSSSAAHATKRLFTKMSWSKLSAAATAIRDVHYKYTAPSGWKGPAILPSALYFDYMGDVDDAIARLKREGAAFAANLDQHKAEARTLLGSAFRDEDYPSADQFMRAIRVDVDIIPWPDGKQFATVAMLDTAAEQLEQQFRSRTDEKIEQAMSAFYRKLYDVVEKVAEKFSDPDRENMKVFSTLLTNISDILPILRSVNIGDSDTLRKMADEAEAKLLQFDIEDLRQSPQARRAAKYAAQDVMSKLSAYI